MQIPDAHMYELNHEVMETLAGAPAHLELGQLSIDAVHGAVYAW